MTVANHIDFSLGYVEKLQSWRARTCHVLKYAPATFFWQHKIDVYECIYLIQICILSLNENYAILSQKYVCTHIMCHNSHLFKLLSKYLNKIWNFYLIISNNVRAENVEIDANSVIYTIAIVCVINNIDKRIHNINIIYEIYNRKSILNGICPCDNNDDDKGHFYMWLIALLRIRLIVHIRWLRIQRSREHTYHFFDHWPPSSPCSYLWRNFHEILRLVT